MTYALARKPAFAALADAPSRRLRPGVSAPFSVRRGALHSGGLAVEVIPRAAGRVTVELRRGSRLLDRARLRGTTGQTRTVHLRPAAAGSGLYQLVVRAARAETVRILLRVR